MPSTIKMYKRRPKETLDYFANQYKCCIARCVYQSKKAHAGDDQQWAVMLIRIGMSTPDTLLAITFQITTGDIASKKRAH